MTNQNSFSKTEKRHQTPSITINTGTRDNNRELTAEEMKAVAGGRIYRITNVRTNANGIGGGSASGAIPVQ
jgi:hypothetical protein